MALLKKAGWQGQGQGQRSAGGHRLSESSSEGWAGT